MHHSHDTPNRKGKYLAEFMTEAWCSDREHSISEETRKDVDWNASSHQNLNSNQFKENKSAWKEAQQQPFNTHNRLKEEKLMVNVWRIEVEHREKKYGKAWKVINKITVHKKAKDGLVAGTSLEESVTTRFTLFCNLLGSTLDVEGADEEIPDILMDWNINDGPFTAKEYAKARESLKHEKDEGQTTYLRKFSRIVTWMTLCWGSVMMH